MEDWFLAWPSVSAEPFRSLVERMWVLGLSDRVVGYVTTWSDVSVGRCLSDMIVGLVPTWSDVSAGQIPTCCLALHPAWKRVGSVELPVMRRIMRKHLWRFSIDDPTEMIQIHRWSRSRDDAPEMIQIEWWSRSSDDLDQVMIQIQWWWSRSSDGPDTEMKMTWRWRWLEVEYDLKMQMTRRSREEDHWWKLCRENTFLVKREC